MPKLSEQVAGTSAGSQAGIWATRHESLSFLARENPSKIAALDSAFALLDDCVDAIEEVAAKSTYAEVCGLCALKIKNLAVGTYGLILDGLGQETGALMRPMIEYAELLTYFRMFPSSVEQVASNTLPKAGERAKAIGGIYKDYREHLNEHASHSSFSSYAIAHLREPSTNRFKKLQRMVPHVLGTNLRDLVVLLMLFLRELVLALQTASPARFERIAKDADLLRDAVVAAYDLRERGEPLGAPDTKRA
jgi:hypothetical protein